MRTVALCVPIVLATMITMASSSAASAADDGLVLYDFFGLKDASDLGMASDLPYKVGPDFGVHRKKEPQSIQWIESWIQNAKSPGGDNQSFLMCFYSVTAKDSWNGAYFKLHDADHTEYVDGDLVIRLRQFPDVTKARGGNLPTDALTIAWKAVDKNGTLLPAELAKTIGLDEKRQQVKHGSFDLRIPLRDFGNRKREIDLKRCVELVINFEERDIPEEMEIGVIGIQAVLLTKASLEGAAIERQRTQADAILTKFRAKKGN